MYQEFLSGGWDGAIHVWDSRRPRSVRRFPGPFVAGEGLDICRKGREVAVASWRGANQLQVLDYGSGELISDLEPDRQSSYLSCVQAAHNKYPRSENTFYADTTSDI